MAEVEEINSPRMYSIDVTFRNQQQNDRSLMLHLCKQSK